MKYSITLLLICFQMIASSVFAEDDLSLRIVKEGRVSCLLSCDELIDKITDDNYEYVHNKIAAIILRDFESLPEFTREDSHHAGYANFDDPVIQKFADCDTTKSAIYNSSGDGGFKELAQCIVVDNFDKIYEQKADAFVDVLLKRWSEISISRYGEGQDVRVLLYYIDSAIEAVNILQNPDNYQSSSSAYVFGYVPQITQFVIRRMHEKLDEDLINKYLFAMKDIRARVKTTLNIEQEKAPIESDISYDNDANDIPGWRANDKAFFVKYMQRAEEYYQQKEYYKIHSLKSEYATNISFLDELPINKENITEYNNLAFYLQKSNDNVEAIKLLKKVIESDPNRTVAYLNIADSYSILNKAEKARMYYVNYFFKMMRSGNSDKIPARLLQKYPQQYQLILEISNGLDKESEVLLKEAITGDLNNDGKDDFVFLLSAKLSKTTLFVYLSDEEGYSKVLHSNEALGDNNNKNLESMSIKNNSVFLKYSLHQFNETYQFLWRNNAFILAGLERKNQSPYGSSSTSINFLTKTMIDDVTEVSYVENERIESSSTKTKTFKMEKNLKLENFNKEFNLIENKVFFQDSYELELSDSLLNEKPLFTLFLNKNDAPGLHLDNAKVYVELTDNNDKRYTQFLYDINVTPETTLVDDNYLTIDSKGSYNILDSGKNHYFLPKDIKQGVYQLRVVLKHPETLDIFSNAIEIKLPL